MFSSIKMIFAVLLISSIAGAGMYVMKLRSDNAILKANQSKLESAITEQNKVLEQQKEDFTAILESNKKLNVLINTFKKDLQDLDKRFTKKNRDIGKLAIERTKSIERIINGGSKNAARCIELASGAEHTEEELKATLKSEINPECPSLANPNYVPYP
jgi:chromosome segregation ATPase